MITTNKIITKLRKSRSFTFNNVIVLVDCCKTYCCQLVQFYSTKQFIVYNILEFKKVNLQLTPLCYFTPKPIFIDRSLTLTMFGLVRGCCDHTFDLVKHHIIRCLHCTCKMVFQAPVGNGFSCWYHF